MDKEALFTIQVPTEDFEIEGLGTIKLRGLTRWQMIHLFRLEDNKLKQEQAALSFGMLDPTLTEDEVAQWQKIAPGGLINQIAMRINALSGIGKDAAKSEVPGDGERSVD